MLAPARTAPLTGSGRGLLARLGHGFNASRAGTHWPLRDALPWGHERPRPEPARPPTSPRPSSATTSSPPTSRSPRPSPVTGRRRSSTSSPRGRRGRHRGGPRARHARQPAPPRAGAYDRCGNRVDEVEFHPSWHWLMERAVGHGLQARAVGAAGGRRPHAHLRRAAGFFAWSQTEPGHGCPISMTYAAVPALRADEAHREGVGAAAGRRGLRPRRAAARPRRPGRWPGWG